jgi:hypothetical protein
MENLQHNLKWWIGSVKTNLGVEDGRELLRVRAVPFPVEFAVFGADEIVAEFELAGVNLPSIRICRTERL